MVDSEGNCHRSEEISKVLKIVITEGARVKSVLGLRRDLSYSSSPYYRSLRTEQVEEGGDGV